MSSDTYKTKFSQDKHNKYVEFYDDLKQNPKKDTEYWGLGIENETYLMLETLHDVPKRVLLNNHKRERYSVDYWKNYKLQPLASTLSKLPESLQLPIYINSYLLQNTDLNGEHKTIYRSGETNPRFNGTTVDAYIRKSSPTINALFNKNLLYDGDTIEFTTFNFYKTNVQSVVGELLHLKTEFLNEINSVLVSKDSKTFKENIIFPPFNYGFATFMSNPENLAICNNGTYHINITMPTELDGEGNIANLDEFKRRHANAIRGIQWIEPLLGALYGSPDILHELNPLYSGGSQRLSLSRYIGLGTYDTRTMEKGKLLDSYDYRKYSMYFNEMHKDSPYNPPGKIGFDINYNKFTKHGIELRIFDYFPEEHLESVINLLILVCEYSAAGYIADPKESDEWNELAIDCIQKGSAAPISRRIYNKLYKIFDMSTCSCWPFYYDEMPLQVLQKISNHLYKRYKLGAISSKMSPNMKPVILVDYNSIIKNKFKGMLS